MNRFKAFFLAGKHKDNTIKFLTDRLATLVAQKVELEQQLETSRRLYSAEREKADRAIEAATFVTEQNEFLQKALMRAIEKGKEDALNALQDKEEKTDHDPV